MRKRGVGAAGAATASSADAQAILAALLSHVPSSAPRPKLRHLTADGRSWLIHAPRWFPLAPAEFERLWGTRPARPPTIVMMGKRIDAPRYQRSFGVDYAFSGSVAQSSPFADEPLMQQLSTRFMGIGEEAGGVARITGELGALLNYYDASEGHYIGPHSDNEAGLVEGMPIFSLSWGQMRRFRLTPRTSCRSARGIEMMIPLADGDLVVMGGTCQSTHKHEVMKPLKAERLGHVAFCQEDPPSELNDGGVGEEPTRPLETLRINATFRFFKSEERAEKPSAMKRSRRAPPAEGRVT